MELDNIDVLLGMIIGCIILGIGLSLFFTQSYTGYGAVVLAIGMMTLSLMITARPRVIERIKRENMLQPIKQPTPTPPVQPSPSISPDANAVAPQADEPAPTLAQNNNDHVQANEAQQTETPPTVTESAQPQAQENTSEQKETQETPVPAAAPV